MQWHSEVFPFPFSIFVIILLYISQLTRLFNFYILLVSFCASGSQDKHLEVQSLQIVANYEIHVSTFESGTINYSLY